MGLKKFFIFVCIGLVIALIAFIAIIKIGFNDWMSGATKKGDEIKKSSLGDEFLIEYETTTMPDLETSVLIKEKGKTLWWECKSEREGKMYQRLIVGRGRRQAMTYKED